MEELERAAAPAGLSSIATLRLSDSVHGGEYDDETTAGRSGAPDAHDERGEHGRLDRSGEGAGTARLEERVLYWSVGHILGHLPLSMVVNDL